MSARLSMAALARIAAAAGVVAVLGSASAGCSVARKIDQIKHTVDSNRATIKAFTDGLKYSKSAPFQASYVTTGDQPTTITYAVRPPESISFAETATGADTSSTRLISNASGQYSCSQSAAGARWTCDKLRKASAIAQRQLFALYTPDHWVTVLHVFAIGTGLAGNKVTTSSRTVNGFAMHCIDLFTKGEGTSVICTTKQNILGYVKVASTSFAIKSYTSSPPASAFALPSGATITNQ
ncbi:MAG TPA: hypothetical protein VFW16_10705 [Streptosporangiaceae bacterium]|nr:hypothetical protein [Streptosporangiaceae bacterium]